MGMEVSVLLLLTVGPWVAETGDLEGLGMGMAAGASTTLEGSGMSIPVEATEEE